MPRRSWRGARARRAASSIEPGIDEPAAKADAVLVAEALHVRGVRDVAGPHRKVDIVGLVGEVALDVQHDLAASRRVELASLGAQHAVELRIVDAAAIPRRAAEERLVEELVDLGDAGAEGSHGHLVELAEKRHRRVPALVLGLELRGDADLREIVHGQDRKSTRLNSSHMSTSYAVFC